MEHRSLYKLQINIELVGEELGSNYTIIWNLDCTHEIHLSWHVSVRGVDSSKVL